MTEHPYQRTTKMQSENLSQEPVLQPTDFQRTNLSNTQTSSGRLNSGENLNSLPKPVKKKKERVHNEHFRTVSLSNRKSCPNCAEKLPSGEYIWSWGEYVNAKWRTVRHFCRACYTQSVQGRLLAHKAECGCNFNLVGYHTGLPLWLKL